MGGRTMDELEELERMHATIHAIGDRCAAYRAMFIAHGFHWYTAEQLTLQYHAVICDSIRRNAALAAGDAAG